MKNILTISSITIALMLTFAACQIEILAPDIIPPSTPTHVGTIRGDNFIEITWYSSPERDVAGYNIYVSSSLNGTYRYIAHTGRTSYIDYGARNGTTYYYAVSAYDDAGNESRLSRDIAYDTPRPEGINVPLADYRTQPTLAGYDFSTYSIGDYNDAYTDFYYEYYQGNFYLNVWTDSDIQDMGYTSSLYEINEAPTGGWSPTGDARVYPGHTYVISTWDNHYAKIRVISVSANRIVFDWAYQLQAGNPEFKQTAKVRAALQAGSGATNRM